MTAGDAHAALQRAVATSGGSQSPEASQGRCYHLIGAGRTGGVGVRGAVMGSAGPWGGVSRGRGGGKAPAALAGRHESSPASW